MNSKKRSLYSEMCVFTVSMIILLVAGVQAQDDQNTTNRETLSKSEATNQVPNDSESIVKGRSLFGQHCTVCHAVGKQVIGPALASVQNRRPIDWLVGFIQNSQRVIIDQEDEYAQYLYQQYEEQVMPNFEFLSRDEILDILAYIQVESSSTTAGVSSLPEAQAEVAQNGPDEESVANSALGATPGNATSPLTIVLVGIILALLVVIVVLATRNRTKATP